MNPRLYIENQEVELDEKVQFSITRQFEDITDPTVMINDWSKTVSIPSTQSNDRLFGMLYNIDRVTTEATGTSVIKSYSDNKLQGADVFSLNSDYTASLTDSILDIETSVTFHGEIYAYAGLWIAPCLSDGVSVLESYAPQRIVKPSTGRESIYFDVKNYFNALKINLNGAASTSPYLIVNINSTLPAGKYELLLDKTVSEWTRGYFHFTASMNLRSVISSEVRTGLYFDPFKKLDFRLDWNGTVIMEGYAKMNDITRQGTRTSYNVTLNGSFGKVMQELKKITFKPSEKDTKYYINGEDYYNERINAEIVHDSWTNGHDGETDIHNCEPYELIGFAASNAYQDSFDHKSYVLLNDDGNEDIKTFEDTLPDNFEQKALVSKSTAIGDGLKPLDIAEFRSYYQIPFYWFDSFFSVIKEKGEDITGYTWNLDSDWFRSDNPYWSRMVLCGKPLIGKDSGKIVTGSDTLSFKALGSNINSGMYGYDSVTISTGTVQGETGTLTPQYIEGVTLRSGEVSKNNTYAVGQAPTSGIYPRYDQYFDVKVGAVEVSLPLMKLTASLSTELYQGLRLREGSRLVFKYEAVRTEDNVTLCSETGVVDSLSFYRDGDNKFTASAKPMERFRFANTDYTKGGVRIFFTVTGEGGGYQFEAQNMEGLWRSYDPIVKAKADESLTECTRYELKGSYSKMTYDTAWDNEKYPFDYILKYCKMFRIGIFVDDSSKTVTFKQIHKYLKEKKGVYADWTDRVDYSKEYKITPVSWDSKYILMGYDDSDSTDLSERYREKYGLGYGEKRIVTEYNFNDESKSLFSDDPQPISYSVNIKSWEYLIQGKVDFRNSGNIFISDTDSDGKAVDMFGTFGLSPDVKAFDTIRQCCITDDTDKEIITDTYCYNQTGYRRIDTDTYRTITEFSEDKRILSLFNLPKETYSGVSLESYSDIYDLIWRNYINERYDSSNKLLTCHIKMNPIEFSNFKFNQFVRIGRQLFAVNKIYDFSLSGGSTVKMDLITIQNPEGYYHAAIDDLLPNTEILDFPDTMDNLWGYSIKFKGDDPVITYEALDMNVQSMSYSIIDRGDYKEAVLDFTNTDVGNRVTVGSRVRIKLDFGSASYENTVTLRTPVNYGISEISMPKAGGTRYVTLDKDASYEIQTIEAEAHPDIFDVLYYFESGGSKLLQISIKANTTGSSRSDFVWIDGKYRIKVVQMG